MISEKQVQDAMSAAEPKRHSDIAEIQSGITHTSGTAEAVSDKPDVVHRSKAAKQPLAVVVSVAGVTGAGLVWWRRRRRR